MNKKISTPLAISIIVALAVLVGGGIWWYTFNSFKKLSEIPQIEIKSPIDRIAGWLTFKNQYFSFKYPSYWGGPALGAPKLNDPNMISFSSNAKFQIEVTVYLNESYEDITKNLRMSKDVQEKEIIIDGVKGVEFIRFLSQSNEADIFFPYPGINAVGWITYVVEKKYPFDLSLFETFASTFKFILQENQKENLPVIDSITPNNGPVGTVIDIKGKNFSGFEGDLIAWIENSKGEKGILYSINQYTGNSAESILIKTKIESRLCTTDNSYSGIPCSKYLDIIPGVYKIYTSPWGNKSNSVEFTVTQ